MAPRTKAERTPDTPRKRGRPHGPANKKKRRAAQLSWGYHEIVDELIREAKEEAYEEGFQAGFRAATRNQDLKIKINGTLAEKIEDEILQQGLWEPLQCDFDRKPGGRLYKEDKFYAMRVIWYCLKNKECTSMSRCFKVIGKMMGLCWSTVKEIAAEYFNSSTKGDRIPWAGFTDTLYIGRSRDMSAKQVLKREHMLYVHDLNMKRIFETHETSTYAELHEMLMRKFPALKISYQVFIRRMEREFNYRHQPVLKDCGGLDTKSLFQKRMFLIRYSEARALVRAGKASLTWMDET